MGRAPRTFRGLAVGLACVACAASAEALSIVGFWQGTITCREWDGVTTKEKDRFATLDVIQADAATFQAAINGIRSFNGQVIQSAANGLTGGEAVMNGCDVDPFPIDGARGEMIHLRAKVNPDKGTGTITGTGIFELGGGQPALGVCKLEFKRVSLVPGALTPVCPP